MDELIRATDDMSEDEVVRARAQMKAGMLMGLEGASSRCERLARMVSIFNRVPSLDEVIAKIDNVDATRVKEFATNICTTAPALALYGPVSDAPDVSQMAQRLVA